jgi:hypothetical protein
VVIVATTLDGELGKKSAPKLRARLRANRPFNDENPANRKVSAWAILGSNQ